MTSWCDVIGDIIIVTERGLEFSLCANVGLYVASHVCAGAHVRGGQRPAPGVVLLALSMLFFFRNLFIFMCKGVFPACPSVCHVCAWNPWRSEWVLDSLELDL